MRSNIKGIKHCAGILAICFMLLACFADVHVYAAGGTLPSGIGYDAIGDEVGKYFKEHEATAAGFAYSVFDESGDIATGYLGYSDKENGIAVDEDTVFEWGSGSKMLVWVSVMQAYEQGKLKLDEDIRNYLPDGFLSNQKYETPITMVELMNHTAGFQDVPVDMSIVQDGYLTTLEEAVSAHKPDQIYKPGTVTSYSNWTTSLAAYIVSRAYGMEYTDYVHKYIFEPLGMERVAFSSNLRDNEWIKENRKKLQCYSDLGVLNPAAYSYCTLYPAGGCVSTFKEYSQFAKALLSRSDKLMKAETWDLLYSPTDYFGDTGVAKNCHGLWYVYFSVPTVGHIGKTAGCSSYVLLDLKDKVGAALICNQGNEMVLTEDMMSLFFGNYKTSEYYNPDVAPTAGYLNAKMVKVGPFKLSGLLGTLDKDMTREYWTISDDYSPSVMDIAYMDFIRLPAIESLLNLATLALFAVAVVFMLIMLVVRIIMFIVRLIKKGEKHKYPLRVWSVILSVLPLFVPLGFLMMLTSTSQPSYTFAWIPVLICILAVVMIAMLIYGCIRNIKAELPKASKAYNWAIIACTLITILNIGYWNLYMFWKL